MEEFEVVGTLSGGKAGSSSITVAAIGWKEPSYIKFLPDRNIQVGGKVHSDGRIIIVDGSENGTVQAVKRAGDLNIRLDFDPRNMGAYSLDGHSVYLSGEFPSTLFVDGIMISTVEAIGLHHRLPEKWLMDDGFDPARAHAVAGKVEKMYVESLGVGWPSYLEEVEMQLRKSYGKGMDEKAVGAGSDSYLLCWLTGLETGSARTASG